MITIMRGIPGSGKSHTASEMIETSGFPEWEIFSADQFFMVEGVYNFDPSRIALAHQDCFRRFYKAATESNPREALLIVDNTNIRLWECSPYVLAGEAAGHAVELVHVQCILEKAIARNTHGVPEAVIRRMANDFEAPLPFWNHHAVENP